MSRKIQLPEEPFELTLTGLSSHAEGVGRYDNKVIFVDGGLPEEKCLVRVYQKGRNMARARVVEVLSPSPDRVEPPCPHYKECGGCQLQHLAYSRQATYKRQTVADALHHVGNLAIEPNEIIPAEEDFNYRNKMTFPLLVEDGKIKIGLHPRNSYKNLTPLNNCLLIEKSLQEILNPALDILNNIFKPSDVFIFKENQGNLRYLQMRTFAGKPVLNLVLRNYDEDLCQQLGEKWLQLPQVASVAFYESSDINDYDWGMKPPRKVMGQDTFHIQFRDIYGIARHLTFLQTNSRMTQHLYEYALSRPVEQKDVLFDGYCGIGLFSLALAKDYQKVIGIELDPHAIEAAQEAANLQNIENCHFIPAPVEHALRIFANPLVTNPKPLRPIVEHFAEKALAFLGGHKITTVILDPPRSGCHPKVIKRLGEIQPKDIILVSCHPATLARDLIGILSLGYKPVSVQPFDLFPQTFHVETVVHLKRI
jgi:23S rRNA (uracil1939-C5)-methyltransferase